MKIVVNRCYGGFGLSEKAMLRYAELKGLTLYPIDKSLYTMWSLVPPDELVEIPEGEAWQALTPEEREKLNDRFKAETLWESDIPRNDPMLVQVVEELGDASSGQFAALEVVEIPDDVEWEIEEYDGREWVSEKHRTW